MFNSLDFRIYVRDFDVLGTVINQKDTKQNKKGYQAIGISMLNANLAALLALAIGHHVELDSRAWDGLQFSSLRSTI